MGGHTEIVRKVTSLGQAGDSDTALAEYYAEDVEFRPAAEFAAMTQDVFRGHSELAEAWANFNSSFAESRVELTAVDELDSTTVLAKVAWTVRGEASGAEVTFDLFQVFSFGADHKIRRMLFFLDENDARAAAGR